MLLYPKRVIKPNHIEKYLERVVVLRPTKKKAQYHFRRVIDRYVHTIIDVTEVTITMREQRGSDLFKGLSISKRHKNELLETTRITASSAENEFKVETFLNGYNNVHTKVEIGEVLSNDHRFLRYSFLDQHMVMVFNRDSHQLVHLSHVEKNLLIEAYSIEGSKCQILLPITANNEGTMNFGLIGYLFFTLTMPAGIYIYFQSLVITIGLLIFSACSLWINDAINPRRHPAINIMQAIVYAVVFALLR